MPAKFKNVSVESRPFFLTCNKGLLILSVLLMCCISCKQGPVPDSWAAVSVLCAPPPGYYNGIWTGKDMVVWGASIIQRKSDGGYLVNNGGVYNPEKNTWHGMSRKNAPIPRVEQCALWTGAEMIAWGGSTLDADPVGIGGKYNPETNSWKPMTSENEPAGRSSFASVWTGGKLIVWGGFNPYLELEKTGGMYDPLLDQWEGISTQGAPTQRIQHSGVWTGTEMIVWGGADNSSSYSGTGGCYNPATDTWRPVSTSNAPEGRNQHRAIWTGTEMIVWGGRSEVSGREKSVSTGGRYEPITDTWREMANEGAPAGYADSAIWTGSYMLVWDNDKKEGGIYNPVTDTWSAMATQNAPAERFFPATVWTGTGMIIWGGAAFEEHTGTKTGAIYYPPAMTN